MSNNIKPHNPVSELNQLQLILSSPSKKIGFLFGAGISMEKTDGSDLISGVGKLTKDVIDGISLKLHKEAVELMKIEIVAQKKDFNIETLLSKISEKERAVGTEKLCGLDKDELKKLRTNIEDSIRTFVSVHKSEKGKVDIEETNHYGFAKWVGNANRETAVEIFTTNYDYLTELALEKHQIPYFDGFVGSYEAFFCPEWIEDDSPVKDWVKLWKLHGSLGWKQNEINETIRTSGADGVAMIYPSFLKYDHSKKQPYLSYMDRLSYFLRQEDSVLFVCGYSFGDEHINEIISTSLLRSRSSHVFVLKKGSLKEDGLLSKDIAQKNSKISVYAENAAVIGGKYAEWKTVSTNESSEFFKENMQRGEKEWDGKGRLSIGDFKEFVNFLSYFYKKYNVEK